MPKCGWILAAVCLSLWSNSSGMCAISRDGFSIEVMGTEKGLPQGSVIAMTQTRDGYLWVGTLYGLARFDGIRFTVFNENNTPGLNSSPIVSLFEDSQTNLWIGTETAGVALIKDGRVTNLGIGAGSREGRLMSACEDSKGAVWLYTADGRLARYLNGKSNVWNGDPNYPSRCRVVIAEKSGPVWVGTDRGLFVIDPNATFRETEFPAKRVREIGSVDFLLASRKGGLWCFADGQIQKYTPNQPDRSFGPYPWEQGTRPIMAACEDADGNLVVGTLGGGVYWFDADGKPSHLPSGPGLSHDYILSLTVDREGSLWVGTDGGGLNRVKRQVFNVLDQTGALTVTSVCADGRGGLWFNSKGGARYWKDNVLKEYRAAQGLTNINGQPNINGRAIFVDRDQRVWAGSSGDPGLFQFQTNAFQPAAGFSVANLDVSVVFQDRNGRLWVGSHGGLALWEDAAWKTKYSRSTGLLSDNVQAIADDSQGNLWIGTERGLNCLRDGELKSFRKTDGLPGDDIASLLVDAQDVLWVGTRGSGLGRFHAGKWTRYTTRDGLINNNIGYLIEDGQGSLWIGSVAGLVRVSKQALNDFANGLKDSVPCRAYSEPDGLFTSECTLGSQPAATLTHEGKLWFSTIKGLVSVNPTQLHPNTNPPPVMIESVLIDGQEQIINGLDARILQSITVPPYKEQVWFQYSSLNLGAPEKARFKYQLAGYETGTNDAGTARPGVARYSKLPPGDYHFHVWACNEDGVWNDVGATMAVTVLPPFWRTWWFIGAMAIILLGGIVGVVHYISTQKLQRQLEGFRQQQVLEKERSRIARDIHDQLGASLTQVSMLGEMVESDKNLPEEVESHARQISQTARDTSRVLDEIVWTVNPSNDTVDGLVTYVCKYAQEYLGVAGLRYRLDVPPQLPSSTISPEVRHNVFLAAKESITNVVRHAKATAVWVRLRLEPGCFVLEIQDDGQGLAKMDHKRAQSRNGLRNMHKRMEDIGGKFAMDQAPEGGTLVRLTVPIQNN